MRLMTLRTGGGTRAARADGEHAVEIDAPDVGTLLADPGWRTRAERAGGTRHEIAGADVAPVVPRPGKILCVGLNYRTHILEMGRDLPTHPT
ncbi:2-hydroxyhepta-2,4-diene-1,7-dioate isomerase, partial [Pseudonocardia kujensis]|nr:2-hydroxyhepta-2,4-diene-1,7-dioate isomerase [Pseudonocardia kujensis]